MSHNHKFGDRMKHLVFIMLINLAFLPTTFAFGESYFCTDEIRTGIFKDEEKWTTKEIKELNFTVKVEGIKIDFKIHGENSFSGCQDFKYDKITDIYQCSNFANGWGESQNIYYEIFSFSPSKLRFFWSYFPGYILDKKGNSPMVGGGTCLTLKPMETESAEEDTLIAAREELEH